MVAQSYNSNLHGLKDTVAQAHLPTLHTKMLYNFITGFRNQTGALFHFSHQYKLENTSKYNQKTISLQNLLIKRISYILLSQFYICRYLYSSKDYIVRYSLLYQTSINRNLNKEKYILDPSLCSTGNISKRVAFLLHLNSNPLRK